MSGRASADADAGSAAAAEPASSVDFDGGGDEIKLQLPFSIFTAFANYRVCLCQSPSTK